VHAPKASLRRAESLPKRGEPQQEWFADIEPSFERLQIYSYSSGTLTIDCRHSSRPGSAYWLFAIRPTDSRLHATLNFDPSRSTIGPHTERIRRGQTIMEFTETVSAGTMITVNSVDASVSRRVSEGVWRDEAKKLTADWPN
jgi:hypothetical protein